MSASDIEAEASEWLVRLEEEPSPALRAQFEEWMAADARHRAAFVRLEKSWAHADILRKLRPLDGAVDEDVIGKFGRSGPLTVVTADALSPNERRPWLAVAASVLVLAIGAATWFTLARTGWYVYKTEFGGFQRVSLQDGSTAFLNTNTEIRFKMTASRRQVVLSRGEALFTVAHDTQRPFDVSAADTVVRAVGTAFSVRLRDQRQVDVLVTEGRVAIDPPDDLLDTKLAQHIELPELSTLAAGEAVSVKAKKQLNVHKIAAEDMSRKLAWTQGRLWFDRVTLAEAVLEFNRYNHRQLVITDPTIQDLHIGGAFDATDLDSFIAALESFGIRANTIRGTPEDPDAQIVHLTGPPPPPRH
jgi:transmembrane sensor